MVTRVQKWGTSQGVRLSKALLSDAEIEVGDEVKVVVEDGALVVTPVRRIRGGHDLRELVRRIRRGGDAAEVEWGPPVGREVW
jgi:antitoxin MazE